MNKTQRIMIVAGLIAAAAGILLIKQGNKGTQTAPGPATPSAATAGLPRLVDLGSVTCIPCKMMMPILENLKKEYAGRLSVEFYDVVQNPAVAQQYGIKVMPTQIFFSASGQELFRHEGFFSRDEILAKWKEFGVDLSGAAK